MLLVLTLATLAALSVLEAAPVSYAGVTLLVGVACYFGADRGALRLMGAERSDFLPGSNRGYSLLFGCLAISVSALWLWMRGSNALWAGPVVGFGAAFVLFMASAEKRLLPLRRVFKLRAALSEPAELERQAAGLVAKFEQSAPGKGPRASYERATEAILVCAQLAEGGRFQDAKRILDTLRLDGLPASVRASVQASRATVLLYLGERNGAWQALKDAFACANNPALVGMLIPLDALMAALDGQCDYALKRLAEAPRSENPKIRRTQLLAQSHALAGLGDVAGARTALEELRNLQASGVSAGALERAIRLRGPASELAEQLASDS